MSTKEERIFQAGVVAGIGVLGLVLGVVFLNAVQIVFGLVCIGVCFYKIHQAYKEEQTLS